MKRKLSILILLVIIMSFFFGCKGGSQISELTINKTTAIMEVLGETEIIATPTNISETLVWENSATDVVNMTVFGNTAKIFAIGAGTSVIKVSGGGITKECTVIVNDSDELLVLTVGMSDSVDMIVGSTLPIYASVNYSGKEFTKADITYSIEDEKIITVENDIVTAVSAGETTLNVRASCYGHYSNVCSVNIKVNPDIVLKTNLQSVVLYKSEESFEFFPNIIKTSFSIQDGTEEITDFALIAESRNNEIATFNTVDNAIQSVGLGSTIIDFSCVYKGETYTSYVAVRVNPIPKGEISISEKSLFLYTGIDSIKSATISATVFVNGEQTDNNDLFWSVTDGQDIVSVSQNGLVTAIAEGEAVVTVSYDKNGIKCSNTCSVIVRALPDFFGENYISDWGYPATDPRDINVTRSWDSTENAMMVTCVHNSYSLSRYCAIYFPRTMMELAYEIGYTTMTFKIKANSSFVGDETEGIKIYSHKDAGANDKNIEDDITYLFIDPYKELSTTEYTAFTINLEDFFAIRDGDSYFGISFGGKIGCSLWFKDLVFGN